MAPRLPRLSPSAAGALVGILSSGGAGADGPDPQLQAQSEALLEGLQSLQRGEKIVDTSDGKTIGQVISPPEPGTNVILAQMQLDRVGLECRQRHIHAQDIL